MGLLVLAPVFAARKHYFLLIVHTIMFDWYNYSYVFGI
jgi:hypothetical protein